MQTSDWELLTKDKTAEQSGETLNRHMHEALQKYVPIVKYGSKERENHCG